MQAGWGFGGKSLPRELTALIDAFSDKQVDTALLQSVARINNDQKELIFRKFWRYFNGFIDGKTVMIWGAAYRVGAGLSTNSAIHPLLALLWSYGIHTRVYAVHTQDELKELYAKAYSEGQLSFTDNPYALEGCDGLFIINWNAKEQPDYQALNAYGVPIFDGKNVLNDTTIAQLAGFYTGIGR
mgnify:FL=1